MGVVKTMIRVVFEAEASVGGGSKAGGLPPPFPFPFPSLPLSIPPKFSGKQVGGKVRSSEGEVPRLPLPLQIPPSDCDKLSYPLKRRNGSNYVSVRLNDISTSK